MVSEAKSYRRQLCVIQAVVLCGVIAVVSGLQATLLVLYHLPQDIPDDTFMDWTVNSSGLNEVSTSTNTNCFGRYANVTQPTLACSDGFYVGDLAGEKSCRPQCGEWEESSHDSVFARDIFVVLQAVVYIISTVVLVVLSAIRYKRMLKFPSICIVYGTLTVAVFELFVLIGHMDRKELFCSSKDLIESRKNPTTFCSLQGAIFYYTIFQQTLLWFFHVMVIFWGVQFPFSSIKHKESGHLKYLHLGTVLLSVIIPVIPVVVGFTTGGYTVPRIPPTICIMANSDAGFYSFILPVTLIMGLGNSLIATMFCLLFGMSSLRKQSHATTRSRQRTAKIKLLIIFSYFYLFLIISQTALTLSLRKQPKFEAQLSTYFCCESAGINPGHSCERSFERLSDSAAIVISYMTLGLYPIVNLAFVVNVKELKEICCGRRRREHSSAGRSNITMTMTL